MTDKQAIIKLGLKTGTGMRRFARKFGPSDNSVRYSTRYIPHSVYDSLDRLATAIEPSERTSSIINFYCIKKGRFLYSACSQSVGPLKAFHTLPPPPPQQNCSFRHQLDFSGKHSSHAAITREDYSLTFPPLPIARYSFIQLSELGRHGENKNAQSSKR